MVTTGLLTSFTDEWATPWDLFRVLDQEFGGFDLDVCATVENRKCGRFYSRTDDGLRCPWDGVVWCNPPYGNTIGRWMKKAAESARMGATVVTLPPARTDTQWWHEWVMPCAWEVRLIRGRVRFNDAGPSPFPSAVVVYRPGIHRPNFVSWDWRCKWQKK